MSERAGKNPVTVTIGGEEYKLRADATPEYTQQCAAYLDRLFTELLGQATVVERDRAAILAALSITDQLFQARAELELLRSDVARLTCKLAADIQMALAAGDLASGS